MLTSRPARVAGFFDRGAIASGMIADLNVINPDTLKLHSLDSRP